MRMSTRLGLASLVTVVCVVAAGCSGGSKAVEPNTTITFAYPSRSDAQSALVSFLGEMRPKAVWAVDRISRNREVVWINNLEGGCRYFEYAVTSEVAGGFEFEVQNRPLPPSLDPGTASCTTEIAVRPYRIRLPRPLADDETILGGCKLDAEPECSLVRRR
jgi:hypothetical protein